MLFDKQHRNVHIKLTQIFEYLSYSVEDVWTVLIILHLSFLKVHKYPNLVWTEVQMDVYGGFSAKGVLVPKE